MGEDGDVRRQLGADLGGAVGADVGCMVVEQAGGGLEGAFVMVVGFVLAGGGGGGGECGEFGAEGGDAL